MKKPKDMPKTAKARDAMHKKMSSAMKKKPKKK
jgi:hypothetical protein